MWAPAGRFNFNGLVRHYDLRQGGLSCRYPGQPGGEGTSQRPEPCHCQTGAAGAVEAIAEIYGARIKVAEVPPGPPVLSTLVAEIYGPDYDRQREIAAQIMTVFEETPGVVDVDWFMEDEHPRYRLEVDREKAALHGITPHQISNTLHLALSGRQVGLLHQPREREDVPVVLTLPLADRAGVKRLEGIKMRAADGSLIPLSSLVSARMTAPDKSIYHKNLHAGRLRDRRCGRCQGESRSMPSLRCIKKIDAIVFARGIRHRAAQLPRFPTATGKFSMKWDGEWHITYEVFRDLGIAFAVVLVLIFVLVVGWFQSFSTPHGDHGGHSVFADRHSAGPLGLGAFFTATSMIGFIAGAGIVVRNSIILVDFIELRLQQKGCPLGPGRGGRRCGAVPAHDADGAWPWWSGVGDSLRPDLSRARHLVDGR
jgi:multidrug efflux pump subunit AcrB